MASDLHGPPAAADAVDADAAEHVLRPPPPAASAAASLRRRHRAASAAAAAAAAATRRDDTEEEGDDDVTFVGTRRRNDAPAAGAAGGGRRTAAVAATAAANSHRHRDRDRDRDGDARGSSGGGGGAGMTASQLYCLLSFLVALLAIVTSSSPFGGGGGGHDVASAAAAEKVMGEGGGGGAVQGGSDSAEAAGARDAISLAIDAATGLGGVKVANGRGGADDEQKQDAASQEKGKGGGGGGGGVSDSDAATGGGGGGGGGGGSSPEKKKRKGELPLTLPTSRPRWSLTGAMDSYYRWWDAMANSYVDDAMVVADAVVRTVFWPWNVGLRDEDKDGKRGKKARGDKKEKGDGDGKTPAKKRGGEEDGEDGNKIHDHNFWLDLLSPKEGHGDGNKGPVSDEKGQKKHQRGKKEKRKHHGDLSETVAADERTTAMADRVASFLANFIDPSLLPNSTAKNSTDKVSGDASSKRGRGGRSQPSSSPQSPQHERPRSATDVIDKVLTSTPRLVAIANFLLAVTYLLHVATADWFLRPPSAPSSTPNRGQHGGGGNRRGQTAPPPSPTTTTPGNVSAGASMGGFLLFKLLLVSSVLSPDTADVLILTSWYTSLSFLRSLAHLAHDAVRRAASAGLPPHPGAAGLLRWVAVLNLVSGLGCVALFHGAGVGMVVLLVTDCAVLTVDVAGYACRHLSHCLEERHVEAMGRLEERQLGLLVGGVPAAAASTANDDGDGDGEGADDPFARADREMERLESGHTRRLALLDGAAFGCEVTGAALTAAHFGHIWYLHGLGFGLVDGVLALHLNSALTSVRRKIAERRNFRKIARDLDGLFEDATESEMRKAHSNGDMCSVCLRPMMSANVKKLLCGHLYHSHCLMEVVERARSIEAARCPLCRSSVVHVAHSTQQRAAAAPEGEAGGGGDDPQQAAPAANATGANDLDGTAADRPGDAGGAVDADVAAFAQEQQRRMGNQEDSLFRFSTEGILPAWLPIPAFSFEVVRRPPVPLDNGGGPAAAQQQGFVGEGDENADNGDDAGQAAEAVDERRRDGDDGRNADNGSFLLRLLHLAGAVPMTEDEEAAALIQLTDMFPQYDRSDLVRELRHRGSAELVAESILMGTFNGLPRAVDDGGDAQ